MKMETERLRETGVGFAAVKMEVKMCMAHPLWAFSYIDGNRHAMHMCCCEAGAMKVSIQNGSTWVPVTTTAAPPFLL